MHLGALAIGRPAVVFTEVCAVEPIGRVTYSDLGLWDDNQQQPLREITAFIESQGVVSAIQIGHAGRKACSRRPWDGMMHALDEEDRNSRGEAPWETVAPSAMTYEGGRPPAHELSRSEIQRLVDAFASSAARANVAGFGVLEIHAAHGYLLHQFLSASSNLRDDEYGGDLTGRARFPMEVVEAVRSVWPSEKPLFVRVSLPDGSDAGWAWSEGVDFARQLHSNGVDVIDCSSGGISVGNMDIPGRRIPGFQVALAKRLRLETGITVMAVGLIRDPHEAERIVSEGEADLVAIGREALYNPRWPLHAARALNADQDFESWPVNYGWWLAYRERSLKAPPVAERSEHQST